MLVLGRKEKQTILIGDNVKITVVTVKKHKCYIGIDAPPDVQIVHGELMEQDGKETARNAAEVDGSTSPKEGQHA